MNEMDTSIITSIIACEKRKILWKSYYMLIHEKWYGELIHIFLNQYCSNFIRFTILITI